MDRSETYPNESQKLVDFTTENVHSTKINESNQKKYRLRSQCSISVKPTSNTQSKVKLKKQNPGVQKIQKTYEFRKRAIDNYLDTSFHQNLRKAIKISAKENVPKTTSEDLKALLSERNLEIVDVPGDGNCFFYSVSQQMYGTISQAAHIRELAVNQVTNRPKNFTGFLTEDESIDDFIIGLSTNRIWADNKYC